MSFPQACSLLLTNSQGISINQNTWRLLKLLGADSFIEQHSNRGDSGKIDGEQR
jgi:salicylate hydroxylase